MHIIGTPNLNYPGLPAPLQERWDASMTWTQALLTAVAAGMRSYHLRLLMRWYLVPRGSAMFGQRAVVGDVAAVHGSPVTRKRIEILFIIGSSAACFSVSVALGANVYSARLRPPITPCHLPRFSAVKKSATKAA